MAAPERSAARPHAAGWSDPLGPLLAALLLVVGAAPAPAAAVPTGRTGAAAAPAPETVGAWAETVRARLAGARERLHQLQVARDLTAGRLTAVEAGVAELRAAWRATGVDLRRQRSEVDALDRRLDWLAGRRETSEGEARRLRELTGHALAELALEGHRAAEERPDPRTTARLRALGATLLDGWRESEARATALRHRQEALAARRDEAVARLADALRRADELRDRLADRARRHRLVRAAAEDAATRAAAVEAEVGLFLAELGRSEPTGPTRAVAAAGRETGAAAAAGAPGPLLPIAGPVVARFGQAAGGPRDRGIVIRAAPGQPVGAPAGGRVVFAGPFRSYGMLLIIDHGDGYHSLLSGMARLRVGVNQWVRAGEPVGSFDDLGDTGSQLYVELRRNGRPVNPLSWLAASDSKVRG